MNIYFNGLDGMQLLWQLNTCMLLDQSFVEFVSNKIYFHIHKQKSRDICISFWEALKTYLRGEIISYVISHKTKLNKERRSEMTQNNSIR